VTWEPAMVGLAHGGLTDAPNSDRIHVKHVKQRISWEEVRNVRREHPGFVRRD